MNLWKSCIWENFQTIFDKFESFQIIRRLFSRVSAIFLPQVKQKLIIMTGKLMYEWPHNVWNNLRLRILGNQEI